MKKILNLVVILLAMNTADAQDSADITSVASLADLRVTKILTSTARYKTTKEKPLINVLGYYKPYDGAGGSFYYDDTATNSDNAGTVIKPASVKGAGRWKRIFDREVNVLWFGAKRDNSADASGAINAAINAASPSLTDKNTYAGHGSVYIPGGIYRMDSTIKIRRIVRIFGDGGLNPGIETKLIYRGNTRGIDIRFNDSLTGGRFIVIKNLWLRNYGASTDSLAHGLWTNTRIELENVNVDNFGGNGFEINTLDAVGGANGNANNSILRNISSVYCALNGLLLIGEESNNIHIETSDFTANGMCGVLDNSFLGNHYVTNHSSFNGVRAASGYNKVWSRKGFKHYQSISYTPHKGIEPGVSPGWQKYWVLMHSPFAATDTFSIARWSPNSTYYITAAYALIGPASYSLMTGCYSEGGQGASILSAGSMAVGGDHGAGFVNKSSVFLEPVQYELIVHGRGLYVKDQDSTSTKYGFDNQNGLTLSSAKPDHAGMQAKYFESTRSTIFFSGNNPGLTSFELLGQSHRGAKFGLTTPLHKGVSFHYERAFFMGDVNNGFVSRGISASQSGPPSLANEYATGEFCLNIGSDTTIIGWKCLEGGKPGKWVAITSANANSSKVPATGTYIGNGGSTKVTIPHGLGRVPSWVGITIKSADAAGVWWATNDATNIYINYKTATPRGSGNISVDWAAKL